MTVTNVSGVAVSFRTLTVLTPQADGPTAVRPSTSAPDSVELSQQAAAAARITDPSARAEVLLKALDTDGDGVVTRTEFTSGTHERLAIRRYTTLPKV